ncbi:MAG: hypothetical protein OXC63_05965 [Aestuariivita sp.]|nr:hypothetical protein [Aestuariivita sp.]
MINRFLGSCHDCARVSPQIGSMTAMLAIVCAGRSEVYIVGQVVVGRQVLVGLVPD